MRILKYVFLLLVLACIGVLVYVATQKGDFSTERTGLVKSGRSTVFSYVNDLRNWEQFIFWLKENTPEYSNITSGKDARMNWSGTDGQGHIRTLQFYDNDSLIQEVDFNGEKILLKWIFRDTTGGTSVRWKATGKVNFSFKVKAFMRGGISDVVSTAQEQSLANLNRVLQGEISSVSVGAVSVVQRPVLRYFGRTIVSTRENMERNRQILLSKMNLLFQKNNIPRSGPAFVIYHYADTIRNRVKFTVGIPVREPAFSSPGSEIQYGEVPAHTAIHLTLKGDHSHREKAWLRGTDYAKEHGLTPLPDLLVLEFLDKSALETKRPSEWVTQLYFPIIGTVTPSQNPSQEQENPAMEE